MAIFYKSESLLGTGVSSLIGNSPRKNRSAEEMHILQKTFPALSPSKSEIKKKNMTL